MRLYENILIFHPELEEEQIDSHVDRFTDIITRMGGQLSKIEKWGKKKLAYQVKKQRYGFYLLLRFQGTPELVTELERNYRLMDSVLRALTVHLEKEPGDTVTLIEDDDSSGFAEEVVDLGGEEEDIEEEDIIEEGEEESIAEEASTQKTVEEAH